MIKKISRFFNKYKIIIVFASIMCFLMISIALSAQNEKSGPFSRKIMDFMLPVSSTFADTTRSLNSYSKKEQTKEEEQIEQLKKENSELRKKLIEQTLSKEELYNLQNLKTALNFVDNSSYEKIVSCKIIAKNYSRYTTNFTVSAGAKDGVSQNAIAINEKGLVGRVFDVSKNYSKIISLLDNRTSVSFKVLESPTDTGIISKEITIDADIDDTLINGYTFNINSPIKKGDRIITSGLGMYPEGIPIGEVENIIEDKQKLLKYIQVKPYADFSILDTITLINPGDGSN